MKKLTRILALALSLVLALSVFAACGKETKDDGKLKIGIIQYMSHPSLDNCYNGIIEAINASDLDVEVDRQTGSSSSPDSDCQTFAQNMVAKNYDMIIAIATPAATMAYAAADGTDIPVIFCAVSDPVSAELVDSIENPGHNCTGTSDVLDLSAQLDLIQAMQPDVSKIGVLYTTSEVNSISHLKILTELGRERNIEIISSGVQSASDIPAAATVLAGKVDCINNFTDNNVVENLSVLLDAANSNGIPIYGSEVEQVKNGCLASMSIDYIALGKVTGEMAVDVLNGEAAESMAVRTISDATPVVNTDVLAELDMKLPDSLGAIEQVTTNK